jgi:SOS-response transcriptional repressor LexA
MASKATKKVEKPANPGKKTRPTKKQHETLNFIRHFISENGYSPSYREIMNGCGYTSVATVSLHVNSLIKRGHIVKRDKSARSLEVVTPLPESDNAENNHKHELIKEIEARFKSLEESLEEEVLNEVYVLVGALKILGHQEVAVAYAGRINEIQNS